MSILKKFKDMVGMDDPDEFEGEGIYDPEEEDGAEEAPAYAAAPVSEPPKRSRPAFTAAASSQIPNASNLQVVLVKPEQFENAREIADHLNMKKTVVLNLESANNETSRRLIDFLSGVAYANSGRLQKVASSTFIITPYNVEMRGEILDELESTGVFF
ncbi:MAG: cell division protein SepF [Clostridia bacterium]|nr:cell division protein SepF [Clostridia bacterium]